MRLRNLVRINPSKSEISSLPVSTEITFAPMESIADGLGGLDTAISRPIGEVEAGSYSYFAEGDLLLAKVTPCFENGKKALAQRLKNGVGFATSEVHVIRPNRDQIDPNYLLYVLSSEEFRAAGLASMAGASGLRRVSEEAILNFRLTITNTAAQRAIADFLDRETARIDQLIAKKERMVEILGEKRKSVMLQCLSRGALSFGWDADRSTFCVQLGNPEWQERDVRSVVSFMTSGSRGWSSLLGDEGEGFIQSGNIGRQMEVDLQFAQRVKPQTGAEADRTLAKSGDVLICITGGRTGAVGMIRGLQERAYVNQHVCLLRANQSVILPELLAQLLWSEIGQKQIELSQYGVKQGLGFNEVARIKIPVPPLAQQAQLIANINAETELIDRLRERIQESQRRLHEFRSALITAAVTGQIDVATWRRSGDGERRLDALACDDDVAHAGSAPDA